MWKLSLWIFCFQDKMTWLRFGVLTRGHNRTFTLHATRMCWSLFICNRDELFHFQNKGNTAVLSSNCEKALVETLFSHRTLQVTQWNQIDSSFVSLCLFSFSRGFIFTRFANRYFLAGTFSLFAWWMITVFQPPARIQDLYTTECTFLT